MCVALVVDDDPIQQLIISKLLKKIGVNAIVASDGIEALEQVKSSCPVLVILDVLMPRMNGYEVCQQLKSDDKTQKLPVVMYSGQEKEFNLNKSSNSGADAYLSKLCDPQELINTVARLLQEKRFSSPCFPTEDKHPVACEHNTPTASKPGATQTKPACAG